MDIVVLGDVPASHGSSVRPGGESHQQIFVDDAPDGLNFWFLTSRYRPGTDAFVTPRHHHAFQQIRWSLSGSINYAPDQDIAEGDLAYFPRGAWYGPQLKETGFGIGMQFGFNGEHQRGPDWERTRAEALERLQARGKFEGGTYISVDPETGKTIERDAVQALYEENYEGRTGEKFVIPDEGYDAPILLHPKAFAYFELSPGVEIKKFGSFYDHPGPNADLRLSMLRFSDGGTFEFGPDRAQVAWSTSAGLEVDATKYPEHTCLYSPRGDTAQIAGHGGVELHVVEFPRLD